MNIHFNNNKNTTMELNKDYYDKAVKRINAEKSQLTLF